MDTLVNYYRRLALSESLAEADLIAAWDPAMRDEVRAHLEAAFQNAGLHNAPLDVTGLSNQAVGNRVADLITTRLNAHLQAFVINGCVGPGYSDRILVRRADLRAFAFELKATSGFDATDSNRIVLTCSSRKLRQRFQAPINHLLGTACYILEGVNARIMNLRLDFLEPDVLVNIRLEASVSQRSLSNGQHHSCVIHPPPDRPVA
jgi:hypothetical protein